MRTGGKSSGWLYRLISSYLSISELAVVDLHDEHFSYLTSFITLFGSAYMVLIGLLFRSNIYMHSQRVR